MFCEEDRDGKEAIQTGGDRREVAGNLQMKSAVETPKRIASSRRPPPVVTK
jgi:hypothetical protein